MTYEEQDARRAELRAADPHGRMSSTAIDRIVAFEHLESLIAALPDNTCADVDLKEILREIIDLIPRSL